MSHKIGFMREPFPVQEGTNFDQESFLLKCRNFDVEVEVSRCRLEFSSTGFEGVVTNQVSISEKLPLGGFASMCYMDEADVMKKAVEMYAEKRGMCIGGEYNNWPSFRGHLAKKY